MFKILLYLQGWFAIWIIFSCTGTLKQTIDPEIQKLNANGPVLIELFTSEGCSSCPPADKLLEKIAAENKEGVYVLSFHVDYWNYLAWKDPFSQAVFSDRQRHYAKQFALEGTYTPQIVVNGIEEFVGSNEHKLRSAIVNNYATQLLISATRMGYSEVEISYNTPSSASLLLNLALVQKKISTNVKRGENGGRLLTHINVVKQLKTISLSANKGTVSLVLPEVINEKDYEIIAFTQQKQNLKILAIGSVALPH